jgi:hypothetical protein
VGYSQTASAASHTTFDVIAPQLAQATMFSMSGMTDTRAMFGGGRFSASTQFDGLTIYSEAGGTLSGTLRIYGYQN